MRILEEEIPYGPRVLVLGMFDGVHRGHLELIRQGRKLAEETGALLRVCTFDRHPLEILCPEKAPGRLTVLEEQIDRIAAAGADELRIIPFTRETAETEPEAFLARMWTECDLRGAAAGWNYTFGRKGRGDAALLEAEAKRGGWRIRIVPPVRTEDGEIISSTAIREKLQAGRIGEANGMLGYPYGIEGPVVQGKHEGSRIGFPTANIQPDGGKQLPAFGVYACRLICGGESRRALVNIGNQPTIPSGSVTVEAHALEGHPDLYGQYARVELLKYFRPETRFASAAALSARIARDREEAEAFFRMEGGR